MRNGELDANNIIIRADDLKQSFGETRAMRGISLDIKRGEVLAIMGPSGSGKSTLLHALAAITKPDSGKIYFNGNRIDNLNDKQRTILRRTKFGFVFQFSQLVPELSAIDNVAVPLLLNGLSKKEAYVKARKWLNTVGIGDKADNLATELSGGQQQRVAIARAMVIEPEVLFADEPTGSLDSLNSERIMQLFIEVAK
ncbi:MAG: ABC transporter ATP-binding protein, partial [Candidatus Saccharibacteria bacterium]|nr:ABC transporter ATP-binding protein [Candidatus Saccharibacteria bacterium]